MKEIIEKIQFLKNKYPAWVKVYDPVNEDSIKQMEETLRFKINDELRKIYLYSDGLSFLDYCIPGVANKEIGQLIPPYLFAEHRLEFISTICGKRFLLEPPVGNNSSVWFVEDDDTEVIVARSMKDFFVKFLDKVDVLLVNFNPKRQSTAYFEDDTMPKSLSQW